MILFGGNTLLVTLFKMQIQFSNAGAFKRSANCPHYLAEKEQLDSLKSEGGTEYERVLQALKALICNKAERGVCCKVNFEVVNGNIVRNIEEMPFIARLSLKTGFGSSSLLKAQ